MGTLISHDHKPWLLTCVLHEYISILMVYQYKKRVSWTSLLLISDEHKNMIGQCPVAVSLSNKCIEINEMNKYICKKITNSIHLTASSTKTNRKVLVKYRTSSE